MGADAFKKDGVPFFVAEWSAAQSGDTWYSLFFLAEASHYVIELTSARQPTVDSKTLPKLEQRMSDAHVQKFKSYGAHPAHILEISSINRATSNITMINDVYANLFEAKQTYQINENGVVRRCYNTGGSSSSLEVSMRRSVSRNAHQMRTKMLFFRLSISRRCSGQSMPARSATTPTA